MKQGTTHTLNIRQQRKVTPEKWDAKQASYSLLPGESFWPTGVGMGTKEEARRVPKMRRWTWEFLELKAPRVQKKSTGEE